jgi:glyoxalase family protein
MELTTLGIHHVTAIAGDPQRNLDFYTGTLGQRFVKRTVNFDVPETYHFYFGDEIGDPGTVLTFFPWPHLGPGRRGAGETTALSYNVPAGALGYWRERLATIGVEVSEFERFGESGIAFSDPDGITVELLEADADDRYAWAGGPIPLAAALRGFHSVTLMVRDVQSSADFLTGLFGYRRIGQEGARVRYAADGAAPGRIVDFVAAAEDVGRGREGTGIIHHVAFRTANDVEQLRWRMQVAEVGRPVTPVQDRQYFNSIYFREPGGVLFEIATDGPGFAIDESVTQLGSSLKLPPQYEPMRADLERNLPPLSVPSRA